MGQLVRVQAAQKETSAEDCQSALRPSLAPLAPVPIAGHFNAALQLSIAERFQQSDPADVATLPYRHELRANPNLGERVSRTTRSPMPLFCFSWKRTRKKKLWGEQRRRKFSMAHFFFKKKKKKKKKSSNSFCSQVVLFPLCTPSRATSVRPILFASRKCSLPSEEKENRKKKNKHVAKDSDENSRLNRPRRRRRRQPPLLFLSCLCRHGTALRHARTPQGQSRA